MEKPTYISPELADSPRRNWTTTRILDSGSAGHMALALGKWRDDDGSIADVLAFRWNGTKGAPIGNPQSRGLPTWFVLEAGPYTEAIIASLPAEQRAFVRQFIPAPC